MGGFITVLNENKKFYAVVAIVLAILFNVAYSAFSSGPSQAVIDRMEIGKQDGLRDDLVQSASGSIQIKVEAIAKLKNDVRNLETCLVQLHQEMGTKTQSKTCSQRSYDTGSGSTAEVSGTSQTGVTLNPGTEATPTPAKEEKPQA